MDTFYININTYMKTHSQYRAVLHFLTSYLSYIFIVSYPCLLLYLVLTRNPLWFMTLLKPLLAFVLVTFIRKIINRKRPYEVYPITPIKGHHTGQSFPSRHTVSAMIIALCFMHVHRPLGIIMMIFAFIIALTRILGSLHYVSDVLTSLVIAILIDLI